MTITREGNFTKSGLEVVDEAYIYKGNENTLIMTQTYTHKFQCQYNFENYPFDTQVRMVFSACKMLGKVSNTSVTDVECYGEGGSKMALISSCPPIVYSCLDLFSCL